MTENVSKCYICMCLITIPFSELTLDRNLGLQRHSKDKSQLLGIEAQQI